MHIEDSIFANSVRKFAISDPIRRFFNKFYYFTHKKSMRHNKRLWPYVRVTRTSVGQIKDIVVWPANSKIPLTPTDQISRASDKTAHLILSGPSINEIDYNQLQLPYVMGVNGSIALQQRFDISFRYYVIIDASFVRNRLELLRKIISQKTVLFISAEPLKEINLRFTQKEVKCQIVLFDQVGTPANAPKPTPPELLRKARQTPSWEIFDAQRNQGFSTDINMGVFAAKTVAYDALQILVWLGFTEIYIHGLDLNNVNKVPRFYENENDSLNSNIDVNFTNFIEPSFRKASHILNQKGVRVYNLSSQSALGEEVFPKVSWESLR